MKTNKICKLLVIACMVLPLLALPFMAGCPAPAPPEEVTPTPPEEEAPPLVVKFGAIHPLTGGLARDGAFLKQGIDLAVDEINAAGGIKSMGGAKLVVSHADSQGKTEIGQSEAERLIQEGCVALLGCYQSAVTFNTTMICERENVPFVITVAVANNICERGFKYTFRIQPNQTEMGKSAAEGLKALSEATDQPIETVVTIHEDSLFGTGCAEHFAKFATDYGFKVLADIPYSLKGLTDLTVELSRVKALNPDILVPSGYLGDGILLTRTAAELNLPVTIFGLANGAFNAPQFIDEVGDLANYIFDTNYHANALDPKAQKFHADFKAKYGEDAPTHAPLAYTAVYVLADAIERAKSADPKAIRDALAETSYKDHFWPYTGPIKFDETGECSTARSILMQIQNGKYLQVLPKKYAEADPIYPVPPWEER